MKTRLLAVVLIVLVLGLLLAAGGVGNAWKHYPPDDIWSWLWPILISIGFLALSVVFLLTGGLRWLWPLGTGFVVQTVGVVLLLAHEFTGKWKSWLPLRYSLGAVTIVLLVMLVIWIVVAVRARWLEQKMLHGMGSAGGVDQQKLQQIRHDMGEALNLLKKAGRGRNAIYELPWFLVIGRPQAGKTVAIKNSGLGLPVRKDWVKGVGGTHTCDWFFTNDLIFLDTPGKWVTEGTGEEGKSVWTELLRLLRRYRGRRPLDGLVVVVPADDLLSRTDEELQEQASNVREVIDLLHAELRFRFPVYLLVSKCDLVEGFIEFFRGLPAQRRHEILGWSCGDPNESEPVRLIPKGFQRVLKRLQAYRLEMVARVASASRARKLFFFTEEFKRLEQPLTVFADILFLPDPSNEPPVFRGFYLTSGTQGEGSPLGQAMAQLARTLGVRAGPPRATGAGEEEPKRSYFLLELFRTLMVGDEGLVARTTRDWISRRRDTALVAFLPAGVACTFLGFALLSFVWNGRIYDHVSADLPGIVTTLRDQHREMGPDNLGGVTKRALEETGKIQNYHRKMVGFSLFRRLGMRRPGRLAEETYQVFRDQLDTNVVDPTLRAAETFVTDANNSCTDRTDVYYSIIWLRRGRTDEHLDDLKGLGLVWNDLNGADAEETRKELLRQFSWLVAYSNSRTSFLPGISLRKMAESIRDECGRKDASSSLALYAKFQKDCEQASTDCDVHDCYKAVNRALKFQKEDYEKLKTHIRSLKNDLRALELERGEPEAANARLVFDKISEPDANANDCLKAFNTSVAPDFLRYVEEQEKLADECQETWRGAGKKKMAAMEKVNEQEGKLKEKVEDLDKTVKEFNVKCGDQVPGSDPIVTERLVRFGRSYRLSACQDLFEPCASRRRPAPGASPAPHAGGGAIPARPRVASSADLPGVSSLKWFEAPRSPQRTYTAEGWEDKQRELKDELDYANALQGSQQAAQLAEVRSKVDAYASGYYRVWRDYLESLRLRPVSQAPPEWLAALAKSNEYKTLLRPAAQALHVGDSVSNPAYEGLSRKLESLTNVVAFVQGQDLEEYLHRLDDIAKDLKTCENDPGYWRGYKADVENRRKGRALVDAREWVDHHSHVAEGMLVPLFSKPLEEATRFLQSPDLTRSGWEQMTRLYDSVGSRFPFSGSAAEEVKVVDLKDLQALLGGETGAVPALSKSEASRLPAAARQWLDGAATLSRILFTEGKDDPKPMLLRLSVGDPTFDPPKLSEDYRLKTLHVRLGQSAEDDWKQAKLKEDKKFDVELFGPKASRYSSISITLEEKKGFIARKIGADWKEMPPNDVALAEGAWAPVKLLSKGLPRDMGGEPDPKSETLNLIYEINLSEKKDKPKIVRIPMKAEAEGLGRLIVLAKEGLPKPPAAAGGE